MPNRSKEECWVRALDKDRQKSVGSKSKEPNCNGSIFHKNLKSTQSEHVTASNPRKRPIIQATNLLTEDIVVEVALSASKISTSQGIIPDFSNSEFQLNMEAFSLNAAVSSESKYKCGVFGRYSNIFAVECIGVNGYLCKDKMQQCNLCFAI